MEFKQEDLCQKRSERAKSRLIFPAVSDLPINYINEKRCVREQAVSVHVLY
jgi:hypothetical protein